MLRWEDLMVTTDIKYTESLMLIYICFCLYTHVSQYGPVCIVHMFCAYYVISTVQRLFFLDGRLRLHFMSLLSFSFPP